MRSFSLHLFVLCLCAFMTACGWLGSLFRSLFFPSLTGADNPSRRRSSRPWLRSGCVQVPSCVLWSDYLAVALGCDYIVECGLMIVGVGGPRIWKHPCAILQTPARAVKYKQRKHAQNKKRKRGISFLRQKAFSWMYFSALDPRPRLVGDYVSTEDAEDSAETEGAVPGGSARLKSIKKNTWKSWYWRWSELYNCGSKRRGDCH